MLNLSPVFDDAIAAVRDHSDFLDIPPLPASVYMLQCDVINHYRYALTHYFDLALTGSFLQNSSIGTPYQKWAKFTNDDFSRLTFATHNLIRYTSRLIHACQCKALEAAGRFEEMKTLSNNYTSPICDINHKDRNIGVCINEGKTMTVTPFATGPSIPGSACSTSTHGGPTYYYHKTLDDDGNETMTEISQEQYRALMTTLIEESHDISDRSALQGFKNDGLSEIERLVDRNGVFADCCRYCYSNANPITPFDGLHESWCV